MMSMLLLSWKHNDYTWNLTHNIWQHSHCICAATPTVLLPSQQLWKLSHLHTYDIIHTLNDNTITLYDTIPQYLWHHSHCIHDIRSPTYDITSRVYDIMSHIPVTSQTLCLWIHINNIYNQTNGAETIQPLCLKSQTPYVYLWDHTQCIHDITHTVLMTWRLLYLRHNMHCILHLTHDLWYHNTLSITSVYYISYQTDYIWQHIHCISVITPRLSNI